jgi:hypothetical protein
MVSQLVQPSSNCSANPPRGAAWAKAPPTLTTIPKKPTIRAL